MLELAKFKPEGKRDQSPRVRYGEKDPNTTHLATWANKPHISVSKIVLQRLDSTSTKELEGGHLQAVGSDTNL